MGELNKQFEEAFPIPAHWIEFDEKRNKYYCPYVADAKAQEYQAKWEVWQFQQSKIEQLNKITITQGQRINGKHQELCDANYKIEQMEKKLKAVNDLLGNLKDSMEDFKEFDLYDKGYRVTTDYIIRDLEEALRGDSCG